MADSFNLLTEPWIPVIYTDGSVADVSIRDIFAEAHDIQGLACDLPTVNVAIFRTLLAIFYRSVSEDMLADRKYWTKLWKESVLPLDAITEYLDSVSDRFDLLDLEKPFLQTPGLHSGKGEWKDLRTIIADSSKEDALFAQSDPNLELSYAKAAQWLIHTQNFDYSGIKTGAVGDSRVKGGKGYPIGISWLGWLGCTVIKGKDFKETLLFNYAPPESLSRNLNSDLPIWEEPPLTSAVRKNARVNGQIGLLTWPQRRILLHNNGTGIDKVLVCNGDPVDYLSQSNNETMTPWRYSETQSKKAKRHIYMPKTLDPGEALWRGLSSLLPQDQTTSYITNDKDKLPITKPPHTITKLARRSGNPLPEDFRITVDVTSMIYGSQQASYDTIVHDTLTFPGLLALIDEGEKLRDIAERAVNRAVAAASELGKFAANVRRCEINGKDSSGAAGNKARTVAYSLIDPRFREWLSKLSISQADAQQQLQGWTDWLYKTMLTEGERIAGEASPAAWAGRKIRISKDKEIVYSIGLVELWFYKGLCDALPRAQSKENNVIEKL
jgi:CRISPR system CASCADE complex protein casA